MSEPVVVCIVRREIDVTGSTVPGDSGGHTLDERAGGVEGSLSGDLGGAIGEGEGDPGGECGGALHGG